MKIISSLINWVRAEWRRLTTFPGAINVMVDLETLGTRPGCKILSIGAVVFGPRGTSDEFYVVVNRASQDDLHLYEDQDTVMWWSEQSPQAREAVFGVAGLPVGKALDLFSEWLATNSLGRDIIVWGNGAGFDQPILVEVYKKARVAVPWKFYHDRCYRTLKGLYPEFKFIQPRIKHHALHDAKAQAEHAIRILNASEHGWPQ